MALLVCRCGSHPHLSSYWMSARRPEKVRLWFRCHANETRVPQWHNAVLQEEDWKYSSVSLPFSSCPFCYRVLNSFSIPPSVLVQTSWSGRGGGGDDPVSLLWISAPTEWASVRLLQKQPALLYRHGTDWTLSPKRSFSSRFYSLATSLGRLGSSYAEGGLVRMSSLWISCSALTVQSVS